MDHLNENISDCATINLEKKMTKTFVFNINNFNEKKKHMPRKKYTCIFIIVHVH